MQPSSKRIKVAPLTEMIKEHGSGKVMGMLQAFALLRPVIGEKLSEREINLVNSLSQTLN